MDLFGRLRGWGGFGPRVWVLYFDLVWLCGYTDLLCLVWVLMGLGAYAVSRLVAWGIAVVIVLWSDCALRFGVIYKAFWGWVLCYGFIDFEVVLLTFAVWV